MRVAVRVVLSLAWTLLGAASVSAQSKPAPVAKPFPTTSLARERAEWRVFTIVKLEFSDGDGARWKVKLTRPAALMEAGTLRLDCKNATSALDLDQWIREQRLRCVYQPAVGFTGDETFEFVVSRCDKDNADGINCDTEVTSAPAKVTVSVKPQGLRWDFVVGGGTSKGSATPLSGSADDVIGATAPDFSASLDWAISNPRIKTSTAPDVAALAAQLKAGVSQLKSQTNRDTTVSATRNAHLGIMFGLSSQPVAVMASVTGTTDGSTPSADSTKPAAKPAAQRMFSSAAEFDWNAVLPADAGGTYLELGALARGAFDAPLEDATSVQQVAGQILKLVRVNADTGSFRAEAGFRATIKQRHHEALEQLMIRNNQVEAPSNVEDFVRFEVAYQRNPGMNGLSGSSSTADRYALRLVGFPELPGPAHTKVFLGIEVNGDMRGNSPRQWKILYGVDMSKLNSSLF